MSQTHDLARRLREVLLDGKWIANTNFKEQIEHVDWRDATRSVGGLNSIALLTFHVHYYLDGIINVFEGGTLDIRDRFSFDMPAVTSERDWQALVARFLATAETFAQHVAQLDEATLHAPFVDPKYGTYARNVEGMIEHSYYHLGQISLIRKLLAQDDSAPESGQSAAQT